MFGKYNSGKLIKLNAKFIIKRLCGKRGSLKCYFFVL